MIPPMMAMMQPLSFKVCRRILQDIRWNVGIATFKCLISAAIIIACQHLVTKLLSLQTKILICVIKVCCACIQACPCPCVYMELNHHIIVFDIQAKSGDLCYQCSGNLCCCQCKECIAALSLTESKGISQNRVEQHHRLQSKDCALVQQGPKRPRPSQ